MNNDSSVQPIIFDCVQNTSFIWFLLSIPSVFIAIFGIDKIAGLSLLEQIDDVKNRAERWKFLVSDIIAEVIIILKFVGLTLKYYDASDIVSKLGVLSFLARDSVQLFITLILVDDLVVTLIESSAVLRAKLDGWLKGIRVANMVGIIGMFFTGILLFSSVFTENDTIRYIFIFSWGFYVFIVYGGFFIVTIALFIDYVRNRKSYEGCENWKKYLFHTIYALISMSKLVIFIVAGESCTYNYIYEALNDLTVVCGVLLSGGFNVSLIYKYILTIIKEKNDEIELDIDEIELVE